jgi:hypothetical protein
MLRTGSAYAGPIRRDVSKQRSPPAHADTFSGCGACANASNVGFGQKRTPHDLLDHLVHDGDQARRHGQAERLRSL